LKLNESQITRNDVVIPTKDTEKMKHQIGHMLASKRVILFCGPPGTGKTMSIMNYLETSPD
jgi:dynein heavy chain 1